MKATDFSKRAECVHEAIPQLPALQSPSLEFQNTETQTMADSPERQFEVSEYRSV